MRKTIIILIAVFAIASCKKSSSPGSTTPKTFTITASSTAGGSISPSGTNSLNAGSNATYTLTPATNYVLSALSIDDKAVTPVLSYVFNNVQKNHTISASFSQTEQISVTTDGNGTATVSPETIISGQSATVTFVPNTRFQTDSLYLDGKFVTQLSGKTTYALSNVTQSHSIAITFALTQHSLDSLNNLLIGQWTMTSLNSRLASNPHDNTFSWDTQSLDPCSPTQYDQYYSDGTYLQNNNGTSCSPIAEQQFKITSPNHWKLKTNGKVIYMTGPPLDSLTNVTITKDSLIAFYYAGSPGSGHIEYWYHYARK